MSRNNSNCKRVSSCPTLYSKTNRRVESESFELSLLRQIDSHYSRYEPRLLGRPFKLSALLTSVVNRGGYRSVCVRREWAGVANDLDLRLISDDSECLNASTGLRHIYLRYLGKVEKVRFPHLSDSLASGFPDPLSTNGSSIVDDDGEMMRSSDLLPKDVYPTTGVEKSLGIGQLGRHVSDLPWSSRSSARLSSYPFGSPQQHQPYHNDDPYHLRLPVELIQAELGLSSGLPNEVDAALSALLILSSTAHGHAAIRLNQCGETFLDLLLASIGIYSQDFSKTYSGCDSDWTRQSNLDFVQFWKHSVKSSFGRLFLDPDVFTKPVNPESNLSNCSLSIDNSDSFNNSPPPDDDYLSLFASFRQKANSQEEEVLSRELSRVLVVGTILVNLATPPTIPPPPPQQQSVMTIGGGVRRILPPLTDEDDDDFASAGTPSLSVGTTPPLSVWRANSRFLGGSPPTIRFAFLACQARHSSLAQIGLQLVGSLKFPLQPQSLIKRYYDDVDVSDWLLSSKFVFDSSSLEMLTCRFITDSLLSSSMDSDQYNDRSRVICGLNLLANLASLPNRVNRFPLLASLPSPIWHRLLTLLSLPDLAVVCASLEALRCLTSLGHLTCAFIWQATASTGASPFSSFLRQYECGEDGANVGNSDLLRILLALVTLEGQAMGSQSLRRVKLVQRPAYQAHLATFQPAQIFAVPQRVPPHHLFTASHHHHHQSIRMPGNPALHHHSQQHHRHSPASLRHHHQVPGNHHPPPMTTLGPHNRHKTILPASRPSSPPIAARHPPQQSAYNHNPPTPRLSCPSPISPQHPPLPSPPQRPVQHQPNVAIQPRPVIPPSNPVGLINLLSSNSSSSQSSSVAKSLPTNLSSTQSPLKPIDAELSDRLQMPPPSLPPPSALRRSGNKSGKVAATPTGSPTRHSTSQDLKPPPAVSTAVNNADASRLAPSVPATTTNHHDHLPEVSASSKVNHSPSPSLQQRIPASLAVHSAGGSIVNGIVDPSGDHREEERLSVVINGINDPPVVEVKEYKDGDVTKVVVNGPMVVNCNHVKVKSPNFPLINGHKEEEVAEYCQQRNLKRLKHNPPPINHLPTNNHSADEGKLPCENHKEDREPRPAKRSRNSDEDDSVSSDDNESDESSSSSSSDDNLDNDSTTNHKSSSNQQPSPGVTGRRRPIKRKRRRPLTLLSERLRQQRYRSDQAVAVSQSDNGGSGRSPLKPLPIESSTTSLLLRGSVLGPAWKSPLDDAEPLLSKTGDPLRRSINQTAIGISQRGSGSDDDSDSNSSSEDDQSSNSSSTSTNPTFSLPSSIQQPSSLTNSSDDSNQSSEELNNNNKQSSTTRFSNSPPMLDYCCEWDACTLSFDNLAQIQSHVYREHFLATAGNNDPSSSNSSSKRRRPCLWRECRTPVLLRAPFALLTHLTDQHCNASELSRRRHLQHSPTISPSQPLPPMPPPPPEHSALSVVRNVEMRRCQADAIAVCQHFVNGQPHLRPPLLLPPPSGSPSSIQQPLREGPVTKHIRLSAALVLLNLTTYCGEARRWLRSHSSILCQLAMGVSPDDSSSSMIKTNNASQVINQILNLCYTEVDKKESLDHSLIHVNPRLLFLNQGFPAQPAPAVNGPPRPKEVATQQQQKPPPPLGAYQRLLAGLPPPNFNVDMDA